MDYSQGITAYDVVNTYSESDLARIIYTYGEESFSRAIARKIVETRKSKPISTTMELKDIIEQAIPKKFHSQGSPCKKTFQAIRIEVKGELDGLDLALKDMVEGLNKGGRLAVITFHSLEDRIVKNVFKELSTPQFVDPKLPIKANDTEQPDFFLVTKKPIESNEEELSQNHRAHSAKLRVMERINENEKAK